MSKKDLILVTAIGMAVGFLLQPIADNLVKGSKFFQGLLGAGGLTMSIRVGIFLGFSFFAPIALWVANLLGKFFPVLYQFAKFAAVGTLNTFISFGILNLQSLIFGVTEGILIPVFATVSFLATTTNSFFWNKLWTFASRSPVRAGETVKFYLISIGGWAINVGIVSVVVNYFRPAGVSPELWLNVGGLCGVAASFLWNFFGYKFFVFKKTENAAVSN